MWTFVHPLSAATALRVAHLFRQGRLLDAKYSTTLAVLQCTVVGCLGSVLIYGLGPWLGYVFTMNQDVVRRVAELSWLAALHLLSSSFMSLGLAIMRVLGYQMDCLG